MLFTLLRVFLSLIFANCITSCSYDSSPLQYNPSGRVLQIENAKVAIKRGESIVGVRGSDGFLLITKSKIKQLEAIKGRDKFVFVDEHICMASSGFTSDSIAINRVARKICSNYKKEFGCCIPIENLSDELADWMHYQTRKGSSRPLGIGTIVAGVDEILGPQIYSLDPQGSFYGWAAVCIGGRHCERNSMLLEPFASTGSFASSRPALQDIWSRLQGPSGDECSKNLLEALFAGDADQAGDPAEHCELQICMCTVAVDGSFKFELKNVDTKSSGGELPFPSAAVDP